VWQRSDLLGEAGEVAPHPWASAVAYRHFIAGKVAMERGAFAHAERELREAVLHDPSSVSLQVALGRAQLAAGNLSFARRTAERALQLDGESLSALKLLAGLQQAAGEAERAERSFAQALSLYPQDLEAATGLAGLLIERGALEAALLVYRALQTESQGAFAQWVGLGRALERARRLHAARRAFEQAFALQPASAEIAEDLARVAFAAGDRSASIFYSRETLRLDPGRMEVHLRLSRLLGDEGRLEEALSHERELLSIHSEASELLVQTALLAIARGAFSLARERLSQGLLRTPTRLDLHYFLGTVHELQGEFAQAEEDYAIALGDSRREEDARLALASLLFRRGEAAQAKRLLAQESPELGAQERARRLALRIEVEASLGEFDLIPKLLEGGDEELTHLPIVLSALVQADLKRSAGGLGLRRLRQALRAEPENPELNLLLSSFLLSLGRPEEAMLELRALVKRRPDRAEAWGLLAYTVASRVGPNPQDPRADEALIQAERDARQALRLEPGNPFFLDSLGWVLFKRGQREEALALSRRAASLLPAEPELLRHLATQLRAAGPEAQEEAKLLLERAQRFSSGGLR